MSVKIISVRIHHVNQTNIDREVSETELEWFWFDGKYFHTSHRFDFIEIVSFGWECGARSRVKRISVARALGYINKLHTGGWIDDDVYHAAYMAVDRLISSNGMTTP